MLVGRFCFQFVQLFGETKEIDTLRIPTIHTIYFYIKPTYVCVRVCIYSFFFFLLFVYYFFCNLSLLFYYLCRFHSPSSIMKTESKHLPKVNEAVNIIRSAFKTNKYRVLCKLYDNWSKLMNGNERERDSWFANAIWDFVAILTVVCVVKSV